MTRISDRLIKSGAALCVAAALAATGCSDDHDHGFEPTPPPVVEESADFVYDRMFHLINVDDLENCRLPLNTLSKVHFTSDDERVLDFRTETASDGSQYAVPVLAVPMSENVKTVKVKVTVDGYPDFARNIVAVLYRPEAEGQDKAPSRSSSEDESIQRCYSSYIGKGTQYYGKFAQPTRSVILYNNLDVNDERVITATTTLNRQTMLEVEGDSYSETMETWHLNVGLSAKIPISEVDMNKAMFENRVQHGAHTLTGSFDFGVNKSKMQSQAYEYYLNIIRVEKAWVKLNTEHFFGTERMAPSEDMISIVNPDLIKDFQTAPFGAEKDIDKFFDRWGTDVITSGLFGGHALYLYGRKENCYHTSVGYDANLSARHSKTGNSDGYQKDWAKIYTKANNGQYQEFNADFGINDEHYEEASQSVSYSDVIGGANSLDPETWLGGYIKPENWALISYTDKALAKDDLSALMPIDFVIDGLLKWYATYVADGIVDEEAVESGYRKLKLYAEERTAYIAAHAVPVDEKPRLVVADVMMRKGSNGHRNGDPQPFVGENPRYSSGDKARYLIYYPMMANRHAPCDNGYAVETSQDKYYVIADEADHYWYYALASEPDVTGITDILFKDDEKDGYHFRGDHPDQGWVSVTKNRVCVKYYDAGLPEGERGQKITAFGLYKRDGDSGPFDCNRIIASTAGSELSMMATDSEISAWKSFWSGVPACRYNKTQWAEGGIDVNFKLWPCMSTNPLPIKRVSDHTVTHPKKWGE